MPNVKRYMAWGIIMILIGSCFFWMVLPQVEMDATLLKAVAPFSEGASFHYLGTDYFGRDLVEALFHGLGLTILTALSILVLSLIWSFLFGFFGAYYRKNDFQLPILSVVVGLFFLLYGWFLVYSLNSFLPILGALVFFLLGLKIDKSRKIRLPLFATNSALLEWYAGLPKLILLIVLFVIIEPDWFGYVFILSLFTWLHKARLIRGEVIKNNETGFIEAAKGLGLPDFRILYFHILPQLYKPLLIALIYSFADLLILDAALGMLGVSPLQNVTTIGNLLSQYQQDLNAWWLFVFPTLALLAIVLPLFELANDVKKKA